MATISRPVQILCAAAIVGGGIYLYGASQGDSGGGAKLAAVKSKASDKPSDYTHEDYVAHFDSPGKDAQLHNVFLPLIRNEGGPVTGSPDQLQAAKDNMHIPAALAAGDGNWIFTGFAVINGTRSALLENRSTHKSDFVTEGAAWKASRLLRINGSTVVFDDLAGGQAIITRFDPIVAGKTDAKAAPDAGTKPVDPTPLLQGPIGPGQPPGGPGRRRRVNIPGQDEVMIVNAAPVGSPGG